MDDELDFEEDFDGIDSLLYGQEVTNEEPEVSNDEPEVTNDEPEVAYEEPDVSNEEPEDSNEEPVVANSGDNGLKEVNLSESSSDSWSSSDQTSPEEEKAIEKLENFLEVFDQKVVTEVSDDCEKTIDKPLTKACPKSKKSLNESIPKTKTLIESPRLESTDKLKSTTDQSMSSSTLKSSTISSVKPFIEITQTVPKAKKSIEQPLIQSIPKSMPLIENLIQPIVRQKTSSDHSMSSSKSITQSVKPLIQTSQSVPKPKKSNEQQLIESNVKSKSLAENTRSQPKTTITPSTSRSLPKTTTTSSISRSSTTLSVKPSIEMSQSIPSSPQKRDKPSTQLTSRSSTTPSMKSLIEMTQLTPGSPQKMDKTSTQLTSRSSTTPSMKPLIQMTQSIPGSPKKYDKNFHNELDKKYYNSMKIYKTSKKIIGYPEESFRIEAKGFKLGKNGFLYFKGRQVIESIERQRKIVIDCHLNASAKSYKSRHRGIKSTVAAIEKDFFWGGIEIDVTEIINHCRVCNPKEYDLTTFQLWKYIEVGVIEGVLIVRDLNEKSSVINCSVLDDMTAQQLSKRLIVLFQTYGTPNAIRVVTPEEIQKPFVEGLRECLRKDLLEFIKVVETVSNDSDGNEIIKLPMVDIQLKFNDEECPKDDNELQTKFAIIESDDISLFFIFSSKQWLINNSNFNTISTDIKNFVKKFKDWKTRISSLTLYFQINGINLKINEENKETKPVPEVNKVQHKTYQWKEVERLRSDFKELKPLGKRKTPKKSSVEFVSDHSEDDSVSNTSEPSVGSKRKRRKSEDSNQSKKRKTIPFKEAMRERMGREERNSSEVIVIDDSSNSHSNMSSISQTNSNAKTLSIGDSHSSPSSTPEPQAAEQLPTCAPQTPDSIPETNSDILSQAIDSNERAIAGKINFDKNNNNTKDTPFVDISVSSPKEDLKQKTKRKSIKTLKERPKDMTPKDKPKPEESSDSEPEVKVNKTPLRKELQKLSSDFKDLKPSGSRKRDSHKRKAIVCLSDQSDDDRSSTSNHSMTPKRQSKKVTEKTPLKQVSNSKGSKKSNSTPKHLIPEVNGEVIGCQYCDFTCNDKKQLLLHSAKHRNESKTKLLCDICTQVFYKSDDLDRHKEEVHPPEIIWDILYGCEICKGFGCYTCAELEQHLQTHIESLDYLKTSTAKFKCTVCKQFTAPSKQLVADHLGQKHRSFKCAFDCTFQSQNIQTLERHSKQMHSCYGKPFECKLCDYSSAVFAALVKHKKDIHFMDWTESHTNECTFCKTAFDVNETALILDHLLIHCNEFSYFECNLCKKRQKKFEPLRQHLITHHAIGPDECERHVSNFDQMFTDLQNQMKIRDNRLLRTQSQANETQNAVLGLMEDFGEETGVDPLTAAWNGVWNDEGVEDECNPTISIPDNEVTDGEEEDFTFIEERPDGQWMRTND